MTITALPVAPNRATDSASSFSTKADALLSALPTMVTQINADNATVTAAVAASAADASGSAATASGYVATVAASAVVAAQSVTDAAAHASIAAASANMKGNWPALTGALNKPASVVNSGKTWALLNNLADVTTSQPGVTADWQDITPTQSAYACNHDQAVISLSVAGSNCQLAAIVAVDAARELLLIHSAAAIHAVCYNSATKVYGTAVLVRATAALGYPQAILAATDKILVASCPGTTAFEAVVLSLTGTAIAVGTAVPATLPETGYMPNSPVAAGTSYVFGLRGASNVSAIAITVAGTTPTIGTSISLFSAGNTSPYIRPVSATSVLVFASVSPNISAVPIGVSGVVLTLGTSASATGGTITSAVALSTGRWALLYQNTHTRGAIVSVSGIVATMTTVALGAGASLYSCGVKVGNQIIVASEAGLVNVLTDVAGTATAGTAVSANVGASQYAAPCGYGSDYAAFVAPGATASAYSVVKISGNNPYIYDSNYLSVGRIASNGGGGLTGSPDGVLSTSTKSVQVVPSSDGTAGTTTALQFGSSLKLVLMSPVPPIMLKQSDSVLWSAFSAQTATNIRIHRLELA